MGSVPTFIINFVLYLWTLFPSVAPYRDTGEMVSVAHTLGIAHPPGYPFYTLISKIALLILPFGEAGYRLNILSAIAGAATSAVLYLILKKRSLSSPLALLLTVVFSTSYLQWYLSLVSEMYTLNTFFAAVVIYLLVKFSMEDENDRRNASMFYLAALVFGLGLGARMDLLLISPLFLIVLIEKRKVVSFSSVIWASILIFIGITIFLYLPVRSGAGPLLDWNHPADLDRFWGTLTRKTHGGTLDLISESYAPGENFLSTMSFYFVHLWKGFAYAGIPLGGIGLFVLWKRKPFLALGTFLGWAVSGPVFIYLSNMPPNTHALAILEAHFILPNLLWMLWVGEGAHVLFENGSSIKRWLGWGSVVCMAVMNLYQNVPDLNKRGNFIAYDFAKNILRSAPPRSVVVMKKDVQLFALWNQQLVDDRRPDVAIISQGLSGSGWYINKFLTRFPGVFVGPLHDEANWKTLVENNGDRGVYFSGDADYKRPEGYTEEPDGLLNRVTKNARPQGEALLGSIYPYRGKFRYGAYREFFTPDIIEDYSRAYLNSGQYALNSHREHARELLWTAIDFRESMPIAYNTIAYSFFAEEKWGKAVDAYLMAISQYESMRTLAREFNSLPEIQQGLDRDLADAHVALGVCEEKLNNEDEALRQYATAISIFPVARAYFNRAVMLWKRSDWQGVIRELEQAIKIDPQFKEAQFYLQQAQMRLKR